MSSGEMSAGKMAELTGISLIDLLQKLSSYNKINDLVNQSSGEAAKNYDTLRAQTQQLYQPFLQKGTQAFTTLADLVNKGYYNAPMPATQQFNYKQEPGLGFIKQQGINTAMAQANATGNLFSGQTLKALARYGANLAAQDYQNAFARYLQQQQLELQKYQLEKEAKQKEYERMASLANVGFTTAGIETDIAKDIADWNTKRLQWITNMKSATTLGKSNSWTKFLQSIADIIGDSNLNLGSNTTQSTTPSLTNNGVFTNGLNSNELNGIDVNFTGAETSGLS